MDAERHETGFLDAFVTPKLARRLSAIRGNRAKFRAYFAHDLEFREDYIIPIPAAEQTPGRIAALLKNLGAPAECLMISENPDIDGSGLPLQEALHSVVGSQFGAVLSCIPGKLVYYEGEEAGDRFILQRK